ncbi:MAG: hypothetical protein ACKO4A_05640 [Gammaproteobacteria bacterium]
MNKQDLRQVLDTIRKAVPRGWILMSPNSLGEVFPSAGFARALQESSGYPVTLCVRPEHTAVVHALYPNRMQAVVGMGMELMRSFSTTGFIPPNHHDIDFPINMSPLQFFDGRLIELLDLLSLRNGRSGLSLSDTWRVMLRLDWDAPIEQPCLEYFRRPNAAFDALGLRSGAYVLFQPGNNTNIPLPTAFWRSLEDHYLAAGFDVLVNVRGSMLIDRTLAFRKARAVELEVLDALYVAQKASAVVSGNNGLMVGNVLCDYEDRASPVYHAITTDKYCKHYDRLGTDWAGAFVPYRGVPAIRRSAPDMVGRGCVLNEWLVPSGMDERSYAEAARAVCSVDTASPCFLHIDPLSPGAFPELLRFGAPGS